MHCCERLTDFLTESRSRKMPSRANHLWFVFVAGASTVSMPGSSAVVPGWLWKHHSGTLCCTVVPRCLTDEDANEQAKAQWLSACPLVAQSGLTADIAETTRMTQI